MRGEYTPQISSIPVNPFAACFRPVRQDVAKLGAASDYGNNLVGQFSDRFEIISHHTPAKLFNIGADALEKSQLEFLEPGRDEKRNVFRIDAYTFQYSRIHGTPKYIAGLRLPMNETILASCGSIIPVGRIGQPGFWKP